MVDTCGEQRLQAGVFAKGGSGEIICADHHPKEIERREVGERLGYRVEGLRLGGMLRTL